MNRAQLLMRQVSRFGIVGVVATVVHVTTVLVLHSQFGVEPLVANVEAFLLATSVSCLANWHWTFERNARLLHAVPRFLFLSCCIFAINQAIVYEGTVRLGHPLWMSVALATVCLVPVSFLLNKLKVFVPPCNPA